MSARRQARGAHAATTVSVDGASAPAELLDPDHPLWANTARYRTFMDAHGWHLTAADRLGARSHPYNRRNGASDQWAVESDVFVSSPGHADWHQLRRAGLIT